MEFVRNQGDKFGIGGFSLGIADGIAEKSLECVQIASVPGYFDSMADGTLHPAGGGLECLCHLGIEDFRDGISLPDGKQVGNILYVFFNGFIALFTGS